MKKSRYIENIKFNKKLNAYFDIKTLFNNQNKNINLNNRNKIFTENIKKKKSTININLTNYNKKKYLKKDFIYLKPVDDLYEYLREKKLNKYFKYFLIHGSLADNTYVKGWSDIDTFVVLKNSILKSPKKLLNLKKKVKFLYKFFFKICPLQHHGLILFTEYDLLNYSNNYLPLEALKKNINLLDNKKKLKIKIFDDENEFLFHDIKNRLQLLKNAKLSGLYKHHPLKGKFLRFPLKKNRKEMYQLFCHLGYINTLPAYYFSCTGRNINKKDSFKLFNKNFKNKKIVQLIKKSEKIRFMWGERYFNKKNILLIPEWVISILGKNYLNECIQIFQCIIKEIEFYNEKKRLYFSNQKYF